jgi:hypothetical protein
VQAGGGSYSRYSEEHYDELFLAEDWMLDKGVGKTDEASPAFFEEGGGVGCQVSSVNFAQLGQH